MFKKRYFFVFALRAVDMCPLQTEPSVKSTNPRRRLLDEKNEVFHFCDAELQFSVVLLLQSFQIIHGLEAECFKLINQSPPTTLAEDSSVILLAALVGRDDGGACVSLGSARSEASSSSRALLGSFCPCGRRQVEVLQTSKSPLVPPLVSPVLQAFPLETC